MTLKEIDEVLNVLKEAKVLYHPLRRDVVRAISIMIRERNLIIRGETEYET